MTDFANGTNYTGSLYPAPGQCPVCGSTLHVTHLACGNCHTGIEGHFSLDRFARLSPDQLNFLEVFIKNRGIIKDVEVELGISYPTVRARLDDAIRGLGYSGRESDLRPSQARDEQRAILEELQAKTITKDEAARRLASLGGRRGGD